MVFSGKRPFFEGGRPKPMNVNAQPKSANFAFLAKRYPDLERIGALCERYFSDDPIIALMTLRQFGELLAQMVACVYRKPYPS
jgi:hypothetical protein